MQITITSDRVYGLVKYYPACEISNKFAQIAGTKSLTIGTINIIKSMGYEIIVKPAYTVTI